MSRIFSILYQMEYSTLNNNNLLKQFFFNIINYNFLTKLINFQYYYYMSFLIFLFLFLYQ